MSLALHPLRFAALSVAFMASVACSSIDRGAGGTTSDGCVAHCQSSWYCTDESSGTASYYAPYERSGACTVNVSSVTITLSCGGALSATTSSSSASSYGSWTDEGGSIRLCFDSGSSCSTCTY